MGAASSFPLYGLTEPSLGPLSVASLGRHDGCVNHVGLGHGDRSCPGQPWVEVGVIGPLHGMLPSSAASPAGGSWRIDSVSIVAFHVVTAAHPDICGEVVPAAQDLLLRRGFQPQTIPVEGIACEFRALAEGEHWAALCNLKGDLALYVCASHVPSSGVRLRHVTCLRSGIGRMRDYLSKGVDDRQ